MVARLLAELLDAEWYLASYPDVRALGADPVTHFIDHGLADGRNPNGWFHRTWYRDNYPEVESSGVSPLLHYLNTGAAALYNPHPRFDAAWYVRQHPEAAANPLLYHMCIGKARDWATEPDASVGDYLPSTAAPLRPLPGISVDVVIPVRTGLDQARRCVAAVLDDPDRPPGRIIVVDDASPETALSAWIDRLAAARRIERLRNRDPRGFLGSANRGIAAAGTHDVVILSTDVVLSPGSLGRLAAQAYAGSRIASVSPLSDGHGLCGYSGRAVSGMTAADVDDVCKAVNVGRGAPVPVTDLSCMYIRRAALTDSGVFDETASAAGPDGAIDFCRRSAARAWQHVLACDTFVEIRGGAGHAAVTRCETGTGGSAAAGQDFHPAGEWGPVGNAAGAADRIADRYPDHASVLARHAVADPAAPFRFAITAGVFRRSGKPTILMVFHGLGGGARRQMMSLVDRFRAEANFLLLFATNRGVALTAPAIPDHPLYILPKDRMPRDGVPRDGLDDLVALLRSCAVARVHLQHLKGLGCNVRALVHRLGVPFDITVHDYFAICPQVNLLPWPDMPYCGEPGPAGCNACIAARPADGATEILAWRRENAWQFLEADRVFCPSEDVRNRLDRFDLAGHAVVVPHEPVQAGAWPIKPPLLRGPKLRIALLGVMANLKGAVAVASMAELAGPAGLEVHIIGPVEGDFPDHARSLVHITGAYREAELPDLIARIKPHVVWFPSPCPETYSYTLTTAIELGLPIVATDIGSFPARLAGRPMTWVCDPALPPAGWLTVFADVREALRKPWRGPSPPRPAVDDYYGQHYLRSRPPRALPPRARPPRIADLRQPGRMSVVVVPERLDSGIPSASAYARLLQPLDHQKQAGIDWMLADSDTALRCTADVILTHRCAIPDAGLADELARHARRNGSTLIYDLEADLLGDCGDRADAVSCQAAIRRMLRHADRVFVSAPAPAPALATVRPSSVAVVPDGLDERLWCDQPRPPPSHDGVVRILLPGDDLRCPGLGLIMPALLRLKQAYGGWVTLSCLGPTAPDGLPPWIEMMDMPASARASYPGYVRWMTGQPGWDIGVAPVPDPVRVLQYAALRLAVVAPDGAGFGDSAAGVSVAEPKPAAWYASIDWLIRNPALRRALADQAHARFLGEGTLESQAAVRQGAWKGAGTVNKPCGRNAGLKGQRT